MPKSSAQILFKKNKRQRLENTSNFIADPTTSSTNATTASVEYTEHYTTTLIPSIQQVNNTTSSNSSDQGTPVTFLVSREMKEDTESTHKLANELRLTIQQNNLITFNNVLEQIGGLLKNSSIFWWKVFCEDYSADPDIVKITMNSPMFIVIANQSWSMLDQIITKSLLQNTSLSVSQFYEKLMRYMFNSSFSLQQLKAYMEHYQLSLVADNVRAIISDLLFLLVPGATTANSTVLEKLKYCLATTQIKALHSNVCMKLMSKMLLSQDQEEANFVANLIKTILYPRFKDELEKGLCQILFQSALKSDSHVITPTMLQQVFLPRLKDFLLEIAAKHPNKMHSFLNAIIKMLCAAKNIECTQIFINFLSDPVFNEHLKKVKLNEYTLEVIGFNSDLAIQLSLLKLIQVIVEKIPELVLYNCLIHIVTKNKSVEVFQFLISEFSAEKMSTFGDNLYNGNIFKMIARSTYNNPTHTYNKYKQCFLEHENPLYKQYFQIEENKLILQNLQHALQNQRQNHPRQQLNYQPLFTPQQLIMRQFALLREAQVRQVRLRPTETVRLGFETQNTHSSALHRTVSESAVKLHQKYEAQFNILKNNQANSWFEEFTSNLLHEGRKAYMDYIKAKYVGLNEELYKEIVRNWLIQFSYAIRVTSFFREDNESNIFVRNLASYKVYKAIRYMDLRYIDKKSTFTIAEALNLVWLAINDDEIYKTEQDKVKMKNILMHHLIQINTEKTQFGDTACSSGAFNQIIAVLDKSHPLVELDHFGGRYMQNYLHDHVENLFYSYPIMKRRGIVQAILSTPDLSLFPEAFTNEIKHTFKEKMQIYIESKDITQEFLAGWLNSISIELFPFLNLECSLVLHFQLQFEGLDNADKIAMAQTISQVSSSDGEQVLPFVFIERCKQKYESDFPANIIVKRFQQPFYLNDYPSIVKFINDYINSFIIDPCTSEVNAETTALNTVAMANSTSNPAVARIENSNLTATYNVRFFNHNATLENNTNEAREINQESHEANKPNNGNN